MPITTLEPTSSAKRLKTFSGIAAILAILQTVVAVTMIVGKVEALEHVHSLVGLLYLVAAVATVFPAVVWGRLSHNTGLMAHAIGMAAIAAIQLVLGYVSAEQAEQLHAIGVIGYIHMALGLAILIGAIALYLLASRKTIIVTNVDGTPRGDGSKPNA